MCPPPRFTPSPYTTLFRSARLHHEVDVLQHGFVLLVTEGDVPELDSALDDVVDGVGRVRDVRLGVDHFKDPLRRRHRLREPSWRSEEHTSELQSRENLVCR